MLLKKKLEVDLILTLIENSRELTEKDLELSNSARRLDKS